MDKQPAVSVIVPVYKAENYLCHCVDSLLAQTFPDFEILLIDDGSPDHSGDICDEYARKDSRVRVFHKENEGVSSTRQCGIDNAKGEYTIHADPDDWVEPDMLEELYKKLDGLTDGDCLVLAGAIPPSLPSDVYEKIMARLAGKKVDIVVDATKDLLLNVLKYHPFLIKPNNFELGEMFGVTLHSDEEIEEYAKRLQALGARNVAISMAGDGSMLLTETGETYRMGVPKGKVVNSVGAGDSMVAGFIASYFAEHDYKKALKYGAATGSATAFSEGLATKDQVEKLLGQF